MTSQEQISPAGLFHRFLFAIVMVAPFYNLIRKSEYKWGIISASLLILTFIFHKISARAKKRFHAVPGARDRLLNKLKKIERTRSVPNKAHKVDPLESRLTELKNLRIKGLITEEEYSEKRKKILNEL